jgi:leader peptidase (prepilin peptidase)/N-methyltransferase
MIRILTTVFAALAGLAFGSFLNVCATRWPAGESIATPRSHCRSCARTLTWWENIPLVSWLALRGRCRTCNASIGWRYPLVEFAVGSLWAVAAFRALPTLIDAHFPSRTHFYELAVAAGTMLFLWLLVALAVLDAEHLWLPNLITLPGIALGFCFSIARFEAAFRLDKTTGFPITDGFYGERYLLYGIALKVCLSILFAAGIVLLIRWTYWLVRRHEGMGLGDAKLMAMLAAWLGLPGAILSFTIGVALAAIFAIALLALPAARRGSESWGATKLPFGTFLCIGGIVSTLWGHQLIAAYLRWSGF